MVARGRFGGRLNQDLLTVDLNFPVNIRLGLNGDAVTRKVGQRLATKIRSRLRKGLDGDGSPLPRPLSGGKPLNNTGLLIKSIKYVPRLGMVLPSTGIREGAYDKPRKSSQISSRARSNFGLMTIHISGIYTRKGASSSRSRPDIDPMGQGSDENRKIIETETNREISRQLARGEAGLLLELGKTFRGARRSAKYRSKGRRAA